MMPTTQTVSIDLVDLVPRLNDRARILSGETPNPLLIRARLADLIRDAGADPMDIVDFATAALDLDAECWRRIELLVHSLESPLNLPYLVNILEQHSVAEVVKRGFLDLAQATSALTLARCRQNPLRMEELARRWAASLGMQIAGERPAQSASRLRRLDYAATLHKLNEAEAVARSRKTMLERTKTLLEGDRCTT